MEAVLIGEQGCQVCLLCAPNMQGWGKLENGNGDTSHFENSRKIRKYFPFLYFPVFRKTGVLIPFDFPEDFRIYSLKARKLFD